MMRKSKRQIQNDPLKARNRAIQELLSSTDLTCGELRDIRNSDLDWDRQDIYIRGRKKNIHLSPICLKAMFAYKMYARWELVKKQRHQYFFVGKNGVALGLEDWRS